MPLTFIPNEFNKIFVYIGIGLIVYFFVEWQKESHAYDIALVNYTNDYVKLRISEKALSTELADIQKMIDFQSNKLKIPSPLKDIDSGSVYIHALTDFKYSINDSIKKLLQEYDTKRRELYEKSVEINIKNSQKEQQYDMYNTAGDSFGYFGAVAGIMFLTFGLALMYYESYSQNSFGGLCESCGKEFNAVIIAGKERDGQENPHFCNNCYSDGKFNEPDLTVDKIVIRVKEELRAIGTPNKKIARTIKVIKELDRWKSQHYF